MRGIYVNERFQGTPRMESCLAVILFPVKFMLPDEPFTHIMPLHVDQKGGCGRKGFLITDHMDVLIK
jgi:hypothetical protein